jgi:hypothetical protein
MAGTETYTRLELCCTCLQLRGPFYDEFNRCDRVQPCACDPVQSLWNAYDYNKVAELCRCCAAECVRSGSRWSLFFCKGCNERVVAHNNRVGRCVIPIGRHSIMNGVSLRGADTADRQRVKVFTEDLVRSTSSIDQVWEHHRTHLTRVVVSLRAPPGAIPLAVYIEHARSPSANAEAFAALLSIVIEHEKSTTPRPQA